MSVTIGIDPHKSTHTAVAVDRDEQPLARLTFPAKAGQTDRLLAWLNHLMPIGYGRSSPPQGWVDFSRSSSLLRVSE